MLLDFRILPFKSNVGYDVILTIDTRKIHVCGDIPSQNRNTIGAGHSKLTCLPRLSARWKHLK
jgi:hypothetical protein